MALELQLIKHHSGILIPPHRDQRYPAIQNPARRCSCSRVQAGTKPGIPPAFFRASQSR